MNVVFEWRTRQGLSQRDLGRLCGASQVSVSHWERGKKVPTGDRLRALARAIGKRPSEILADFYDDKAA
jgi:transcriptional regulator with XRE-family HTH domain